MSVLPFSKSIGQRPRWAFTDEGGGAVIPDAAVMSVNVNSGGKAVSEPIEQGSFVSYNKVTEPLEVTAALGFSGTDGFLQSVIDRLEKLKAALSYFSIVTPVREFRKMTLQSFDYSLTMDEGLGVLYVNADFVEIREAVVGYATVDTSRIAAADAKNPSDASAVSTGTASPQTPSESQQAAGTKSRSVLRDLMP